MHFAEEESKAEKFSKKSLKKLNRGRKAHWYSQGRPGGNHVIQGASVGTVASAEAGQGGSLQILESLLDHIGGWIRHGHGTQLWPARWDVLWDGTFTPWALHSL